MYDNLVIAPTNRYNQRKSQTSINDQNSLPHGTEVVAIRQRQNDDVLDTMSRSINITDSIERNNEYNGEQLRLLPRTLVGKKSPEMGTIESDLTAMRQQNMLLDKKAMEYEKRWYMDGQINGVWMPFTTVETYKYDQPYATVDNTGAASYGMLI